MHVTSTHRFARISPTKVAPVIKLIRGKHVNDALQILRSTPNRSAVMIDKVLRAAMANADESLEADVENLWVREARVDQGPRRAKWRARARGRVGTLITRTSHITVVLDDEL